MTGTTYNFKIRRIEAKEVNSEKIKGQHIHKLYAEEATEGIPKMVITSDEAFLGFTAGAHIKVTVVNDQKSLNEFNAVTGGKPSSEDPMKKDLAERKATKTSADLFKDEPKRKAVKLVSKKDR